MKTVGSDSSRVEAFSAAAIDRAVRNEALTHPATLYPSVLAALGAMAGLLFGSGISLGFSLGMFLVGATSAIINYFFRDKTLADRYVKKLVEQAKRDQERLLQSLREDLETCSRIVGAESYGQQGVMQIKRLSEKYANLQILLEEKQGIDGATCGRIWVEADQAFVSVLDNLRHVADVLKGVAAAEPDSGERLAALLRVKRPSEADRREMQALKNRVLLRKSQIMKADDLLVRNEELMTQLDQATAAVAGIRAEGAFSEIDPGLAVNQLREVSLKERLNNQ